MKKRWKMLVLALTLTFSLGTTAYAEEQSGKEDMKVTFTSDKEMVSNFEMEEVYDKLSDLQPGDSATFKVELANTYDSATDWYMTNEVIESLEDASKTAKGGAYSYLLTYTDADGTLSTIYDSETIGGEGYVDEEGLHEATDALEDFFFLDTLNNGESGVVELRVMLDGETQGNSYQDTLAKLQLNFAVELPTVTEDHQTVYDEQERVYETHLQYTEEGEFVGEYIVERINEQRTVLVNFVKTGDSSVLVPLFISAAVLGILLLIVAIYGLKLRKKIKSGTAMLVGVLLAGALALTIAPTTSQAQSYTYHVRVLTGAQGTFSNGKTVYETDVTVEPGTKVYINNLSEILGSVQLNNESKYYKKGIRESGKDNDECVSLARYEVTKDIDLVVAYGMRADDVAYTVQYINDETGEELYPTQTFYGNVGDKPVVAYQYVENYVPQAYNLTKTLSEDAEENVFTFRYTYNPNAGYSYYETDGGIKYIDVDGGTIIEYVPGTYTDNGVTVMDGGETDSSEETTTEVVIVTTIVSQHRGDDSGASDDQTGDDPLDLIDLDDEDNPLRNGLGFADGTIALENGARILTMIMAIASAVIILVFGMFLILENRKKKQKAANQQQK